MRSAYSVADFVMDRPQQKPEGTVVLPALLCASTGTILSVGLELMGFYQSGSAYLTALWSGAPFYLQDPMTLGTIGNWVLTWVLSFLVVIAMMDTAGLWRRILLALVALLLMLGAVPCLVLWGGLWDPITSLVALLWASCCAVIYTLQHRMPCEHSLEASAMMPATEGLAVDDEQSLEKAE